MIVLFTDFGPAGPYLGQLRAALEVAAPGTAVIDLLSDAPAHDAMSSAYLLAALAGEFPPGSVFLAVVDPGVGSARRAVLAEIDGRWFVGPENGLFEPLLRRAREVSTWEVIWRPERLSASFHGRDLFAPVAARLARGEPPEPWAAPLATAELRRPDWPDELPRIVYCDHFGNAMTGMRAAALPADAALEIGGRRIPRARTFSDMPPGAPMWYENSSGLAEIAVNCGRADRTLGIGVGSPVLVR